METVTNKSICIRAFVSAAAAAIIAMSLLLYGCSESDTESPQDQPSQQQELTSSESTQNAPEGMTASQEQAYNKAMQYLSTQPFSRDGLVAQLEFEKFSTDDAEFAADNCGADWREQACLKADQYLSTQAFSQKGLSDQLQFENFSKEDSEYAAENCGADWNEQAAKKASQYLETQSFSHDGLVDQLVFEGFTQDQAEYGVSQQGI